MYYTSHFLPTVIFYDSMTDLMKKGKLKKIGACLLGDLNHLNLNDQITLPLSNFLNNLTHSKLMRKIPGSAVGQSDDSFWMASES